MRLIYKIQEYLFIRKLTKQLSRAVILGLATDVMVKTINDKIHRLPTKE
jgi:hypothetical protein